MRHRTCCECYIVEALYQRNVDSRLTMNHALLMWQKHSVIDSLHASVRVFTVSL